MNDANSIPWAGVTIMAITVAVVFGIVILVGLLVQWTVGARDRLRDRYVGGGGSLNSGDLLGVPIWVGLEVICLLGGVVLAVLTVVTAYSLACDFRDWWHEGRGR